MNDLIEELDRRAQAKHNDGSKQLSMLQTGENDFLYFADGVPSLEFQIKIEGHSMQGTMVSIQEFDFDRKLKEGNYAM
jgi:hypothetical protein